MEAIGLGIESLRELGITVPAADRLAVELDHQFDHLYRWLDHTEAADDRARPDITEPTLLTAARLLSAVGPAGGLLRHGRLLSLEALRRGWPLCAGPIASRPARCSTATGGLAVLRGESADAAGEAVPSTGTPTTRWRFSSLMSARRSRPPLARIPDITPVSPTRTVSASRADPARPSVVSPRHAAERWGGAPRPDAG